MMRKRCLTAIAALLVGQLATACGGDDDGSGGAGGGGAIPLPLPPPSAPPPAAPTLLYAVPAQEALTQVDVQAILAQGINEAQARASPATLAVVDRVGNVLAVFEMTGANRRLAVPFGPSGTAFDLQGVDVAGAAAGAIAKALTGAYLSSAGNAFSSRTASMIVQQHFPPSRVAQGLESGPLFGVQFSQLPCSDLAARYNGNVGPAGFIGPKRSPLGLAADPGGFPLYKNGVLVGGVGVMSDGLYGFDAEVQDVDRDEEEIVALAAATGFLAPEAIRADRISIDGTLLRFSDASAADLSRSPASAPAFAVLNGSAGLLTHVRGYYDASSGVLAGRAYGSEASGVRPAAPGEFANPDAFVLSDGAGANRFPIRAGTDGGLAAAEVAALLEEAFTVMSNSRGQIRRPLDSRAQVTISVVDTVGAPIGIVRSPDAPVFGIDVSLQKARTAAFFSNSGAATMLGASADPAVRAFAAAAQAFFTGSAFSTRAIGNIHRPYFPDGEIGQAPGPLSRPAAAFNPFATGLQSALVQTDVKTHVGFVLGAPTDAPSRCGTAVATAALGNGLQIFPGAVPIYRGAQLVGAVGVSGDGIDQDDMISFLGAHRAGLRLGGIGNAEPAARADQIVVQLGSRNVRLRYVTCPFAPFLGSADQNVCQGR